jgi:UDP:flavonoid glycosyltransferase YjiC (YdhE family)
MEKTGIPGYAAYLQPISPTREFPSPPYPFLPLGGAYNLSSYYFNQELSWLALRGAGNAARKDVLGLPSLPMSSPFPRLHREQFPVLCGFSEHVVPKPRDWYEALTPTGYWFLDTQTGWTPPRALTDFLQSGPAPVYIGFGSMHSRVAEAVTRLAIKAIELSGQRGILLTGWGGLAQMDMPRTVHVIESAPHDWLFPQMSAVVHHCGAGTTAAGVRAGVPTVGVPFFADQPFWAEMMFRRGAGTKPIPRKKLTAERLAETMRIAVSDERLRARAAELGEKVRREDGVGKAVKILEAHFTHI